MKTHLGLMITLLFSSNCFALFCPGANFNQIEMGDTIERVLKQCGAPALQKSNTIDNQPQEWSYYIRVHPTDQGTLKMTVAFVNRKVVNMSVNGIGVTYTQICGPAIQVGNTPEQMESACGKPAFVSKARPDSQGGPLDNPPTEITELTYFGPPKVTLIFENGKLKARR